MVVPSPGRGGPGLPPGHSHDPPLPGLVVDRGVGGPGGLRGSVPHRHRDAAPVHHLHHRDRGVGRHGGSGEQEFLGVTGLQRAVSRVLGCYQEQEQLTR